MTHSREEIKRRLDEIERDFKFIEHMDWILSTLRASLAREEKLREAAHRVIYQATEAEISMPKNKIVSMELSDIKRLRLLGASIDSLNDALEEPSEEGQ